MVHGTTVPSADIIHTYFKVDLIENPHRPQMSPREVRILQQQLGSSSAEAKAVKNKIGSLSKLLLYLQGDLNGVSPLGCFLPNEECD